jgi:hypothetical protein
MLWIGLIIIAVAGLAAANGAFSPSALGGGMALLILWYLFERERPARAAENEELPSMGESLHESSTEFDLPDFPEFLRCLLPHITRGFGEREISRLATLAQNLSLNRERQSEFQLVFQGASTPLRVRLFRDDAESIGVYFFTSKPLADVLDREMESFFAAREM